MESELARQVEYDMDEQGAFFLDSLAPQLLTLPQISCGSTVSTPTADAKALQRSPTKSLRSSLTNSRRSGSTSCVFLFPVLPKHS